MSTVSNSVRLHIVHNPDLGYCRGFRLGRGFCRRYRWWHDWRWGWIKEQLSWGRRHLIWSSGHPRPPTDSWGAISGGFPRRNVGNRGTAEPIRPWLGLPRRRVRSPMVCRTKRTSIARHLSVWGPRQAPRTVTQHYTLWAKIIGPPHAPAYT